MYQLIRSSVLTCLLLCLIPTASMATGLGVYTQNFDGLDINGAEIGAGWIFFANVFDDGVFQFDYSGAAPNGDNISGLVDDQRDPGTQQLSVFSDYNCCAPDLGHNSPTGEVEINVFQEQTIAACNIGQTWTFTFDAKIGNLAGGSTATAFLKVLNPLTGYSTTAIDSVDMTVTPGTWTSYELTVVVGDWSGQILQFGFQNTAGGFEPSAVFYDNVSLSGEGAGICPFSDDFEGLNDTLPSALGDAGYLVFGNVSDPAGTPLFDYGPFPAPNQSGGFSGVTVGEGGVDQGAQQLNTFSDYNNVDAHIAGNLVESIVYREQTIGPANVGETWSFSFDAKRGNLAPPTTAKAFIKTIDPNSGFSTTNDVSVDMTSTAITWQSYQLSLPIDAGLVGQLIQIGFANTATGFNPSGVYYDNIDFDVAAVIDTDADGFDDATDNCIVVANPGQQDTDGDLIGDRCDGDYDNNCVVNFADISTFAPEYLGTNPLYDHDSSGAVNFGDFAILTSFYLQPPGPSAAGCN